MDKKRLETKVGLFVFIGMVLLAVLLIQFSKGTSFVHGTYQLRLHARNVGGLKTRASVLMSGVQVGSVATIELAPDGKSVTIFLKIFKDQIIRSDARFVIEASGFLGDQYVAIMPNENQGDVLTNNAPVDCEEPFNLQEVARSAAGFIQRIDETTKKLDAAVVDVRRLLLNEQTLTNLASTVVDLRTASERAIVTVNGFDAMISSNAPTVTLAVSNAYAFSGDLREFSGGLNQILATNSASLSASLKNIEVSTAAIKSILEDVQAGRGLAGTLLHNDDVATNVADIARNLSLTTSNLNRLGLWGILWSKKPAQPPTK
jgi:phospholipid/cholesterol/gamma-HCH transport system substrate-binding protein